MAVTVPRKCIIFLWNASRKLPITCELRNSGKQVKSTCLLNLRRIWTRNVFGRAFGADAAITYFIEAICQFRDWMPVSGRYRVERRAITRPSAIPRPCRRLNLIREDPQGMEDSLCINFSCRANDDYPRKENCESHRAIDRPID